MRRRLPFVLLGMLCVTPGLLAQTPSPFETVPFSPFSPACPASPASSAFLQPAAATPCDGCPPRRVGRALLQTTFVNVFYGLGNLVRGEETAKITPSTWWKNMKSGWEWDLNDFVVNQFGHPYQGNNYFTSGRANGLNYWESSALTAFGSATWEYFGETNDASLNDFVNTTLGGIALGEMFHRTAWLIRDTRATGKSRLMKEIAAMAVDPLTGYNRFVSGDASRITEKPPDMVPAALGTVANAGVIWHESSGDASGELVASPFLEIDLLYGDLKSGQSRTPYDAFAVRLGLGGGQTLSEARVRGRLIGQGFRNNSIQIAAAQGYQYNKNDAYQFGAQTAEMVTLFQTRLSETVSLWTTAWGGITILGAVDSVPPPGSVSPTTSTSSDEEPTTRNYDYGPGTNAGANVNFSRGSHTFLAAMYELHHLHVIDGIRGNHVLQRARVDVDVRLRGSLGIGASADFFDRRTTYQQGLPTAHSYYPQFRTFLSWSVP